MSRFDPDDPEVMARQVAAPDDLPLFRSPPSVPVDTSEAAADSIAPAAGSLRQRVLDAVVVTGGLTCDEIEQRLTLAHQTAAARCWELEKMGLVRKSDAKRPTRSGRAAHVYVATAAGKAAA